MQVPNIKFHGNSSTCNSTDVCAQTIRGTDGPANSLIPFHSKKALVWWFNKRYSLLRVKFPINLPDFKKIWIFSADFCTNP